MGFDTEGKIRFFVGYSGWDSSQLEEEIANHVWAVTPPASAEVTLSHQDDSFWHRTVKSMGAPYRNWLYHPANPQLN